MRRNLNVSKMKRKCFNFKFQISTPIAIGIRFLMATLMVLLVACADRDTAHEHDTYTCPMHPTVVSDRPGACPVCGMDLVRKARAGEEVEITPELARLIQSPNEIIVASSMSTIKGSYKKMPVTIEAQGVVTYDTRNVYSIPARIGGRLEKVYLKYPFQQVKKGQKVAEIYSPELLTAQRELLFLLENDPVNKIMIDNASQKLSLLGATSSQIDELIQRKETQNTFAIYSPYNGYIVPEGDQNAQATSLSAASQSTGMSDGMGGPPRGSSMNNRSPSMISNETIVLEGDYVTRGQTLFRIVNISALRVELSIPSSQAAPVDSGDKVELDFGGGDIRTGTVDFIQPFFNDTEQFLTMRVYLKKTEGLSIGQLVNAVIRADSVETLWVPKQAVLDLGMEKIVFIKDKEVFKPKKIITGPQAENWIEVKQGLSSADEIAANAQFLVDSENFIKVRK